MMQCPKCKGYNTDAGYGLAGGGGCSLYMYCNDCGHVYNKVPEEVCDSHKTNGEAK